MNATQSQQSFPSQFLSRALAWGMTLLVIGGLLFALTTFSLVDQSLLYHLDEPASAWFAALRSATHPDRVDLLKLLGQLGSDGTTVFVLILLVFNLYRKNFRHLLLLFIGVGGGEILWLILIFLFDRPRPNPVSGMGGVGLPSFPSGHAELVTTVFVLLLYMYSRGLPSRVWGLAFAGFVLVWAALTGAIRLFLEVHYFTDVLAGYALGLAWCGVTILLVDGTLLHPNRVLRKRALGESKLNREKRQER